MGVGSALEFEPSVSAHSASVFTFDASAGSGLCSTISQAIAADCSLYSEFELAYASGGIFAGIDMSALAVGSLAGSVLRHCVPTDGETALALGYPLESTGRASPTTGAYAYRLPWLGSPENRTRLHVQSSGPSCVTVKVFAAPLGQCAPAGRPCLTLDVGAGQTVSADATSCVAGSETAGWIEASGPVGVVVDVDAAVLAARALWQTGAEGPVLSGSAAVDGPLLFSSLQGWTAEVRVVNLSDADALVAVSFDDREGTSLERQTAWVCANSVESIVLPATDHLPGDWMGVVRVASQAYHRGGALVQPSPLQAVMMLRRAPGAGAPAVATYPLVDSGPFASTGGAGPYNPASDAAVIALPGTGSAGGALRTRIAIANLVPVDGSTDFVMLFVDSNGLVDHVCSSLTESQVEYYDMASLSSLTPDFAGGVVISATTWNHERSLADGSTENRVGLGAVTVRELVGSGGDDSSETFPGLVLDTAPVAAPRCP
jgi:hypothetical protein